MRFARNALLLAAACALAASPAAAQTWKPAQAPPPVRGTAPAPPPPTQPAPQGPTYPYGPQVVVIDPGLTPGPELPDCIVTLSGALGGTYGCHFVQASQRGNGAGALRISSNPGQAIVNRPTVEVDVGFPGAPAANSVESNANATYGSTVWVRYGNATWAATAGGMGGQGAYTVRFSRAADAGAAGTGRAFAVSGTLEADLPAYSGNTAGTLHVQVRF